MAVCVLLCIPRIFARTAWLLMGAFALKLVDELGKGDKVQDYYYLEEILAKVKGKKEEETEE